MMLALAVAFDTIRTRLLHPHWRTDSVGRHWAELDGLPVVDVPTVVVPDLPTVERMPISVPSFTLRGGKVLAS